jgi:Epoxide hydrolase N terminus
MSVPTEHQEAAAAIRPFQVSIPEEDLIELRRRVQATRWPSKELVADASQGVQLATLQELARYWASEYDWRRCEAKLNALPQFKTEIDGVDIHFIHVRSPHADALPLIITHGWPGSVIEMLETIGPLTDPTAYGGEAADAFELVVPSIPGYGFSGQPTEVGWDSGRIASAWAELMRRFGYSRYVAQGGDQGAGVTDALGRLAPEGLLGVHFNLLSAAPRELVMAAFNLRLAFSMEDREELSRVVAVFMRGYIAEMGEHPQTVGHPLLDSPLGLAAWTLDHDADAYEKISRAFLDGQPSGNLTRDHVPRQHHAVLADQHRGLGRAAVLGDRARCESRIQAAAAAPYAPGGLHGLPRRVVPRPAPLGEERVPQPHLLQQGRTGRPLRRLGRAGAVLGGDAGGLQVTPVVDTVGGASPCAPSTRPRDVSLRRAASGS